LEEAFAGALDRPVLKGFRVGTHRTVAPTDTLARVRPQALRMGITRLGNVTGLDRIGIPVSVAIRPNSRSVSVSQGKGLTPSQAMASALMEAAESFHAEDIAERFRYASHRDFAAGVPVVEPASLCTTANPFDPTATIPWVEGYDLLRQETCWVPAEIVHTDYTLPRIPENAFFLAGSNGLAAGNHLVEALMAAVCELIERDAIALWNAREIGARALHSLDLASIDDPDCCTMLGMYQRAGIAVRVWNVTTEIGIPAFVCDIRAPSDEAPHLLRRFRGAGCHPDRAIALVRALTEAAQVRLTYITGIRDDLSPADYEAPPAAEIGEALLDVLRQVGEPHSFHDVPSFSADDLADDLQWVLQRLRSAGIARVIAVDLTCPDLAIPVVRVVIPGLEGDPRHPDYVAGPRARLATERAQ
jgi:YcaO-like protein with predicted kinase domain